MTQEELEQAAKEFLADKDGYSLWCIATGGLSFTTYEDELEAKYGESELQAVKNAIYREVDRMKNSPNSSEPGA